MQRTNAARAVPARFDPAQQHRRAMIAKIQIARKNLAIDEDDYRQALLDNTGNISLSACSEPQMAAMLDWLKSKGFRALPKSKAATHPMARKARALWISLYHLGVVHNQAEEALEAFAKRQLGCDRLAWAKQSDAYRLIEALKSMAERAGWMQHDRMTRKQLGPLVLQQNLCHCILAKLKEAGAVPQDWWIDVAAERLCGIVMAKDAPCTAEQYGRAAAALGRKLRELVPATSAAS